MYRVLCSLTNGIILLPRGSSHHDTCISSISLYLRSFFQTAVTQLLETFIVSSMIYFSKASARLQITLPIFVRLCTFNWLDRTQNPSSLFWTNPQMWEKMLTTLESSSQNSLPVPAGPLSVPSYKNIYWPRTVKNIAFLKGSRIMTAFCLSRVLICTSLSQEARNNRIIESRNMSQFMQIYKPFILTVFSHILWASLSAHIVADL